jgi:uncharacterized protein (TIGR00288 family)
MNDDPLLRGRNVALLIDADNASPDSLDPVLTILAELGTVNIRRAYGNWQKPALKGWAAMTHLHAIEPQQQFDVTKGKSATDMKMTIDAMDLLYRGHVHGFGIMSSDSDFMPLAMRIRQDGVPVYGSSGRGRDAADGVGRPGPSQAAAGRGRRFQAGRERLREPFRSRPARRQSFLLRCAHLRLFAPVGPDSVDSRIRSRATGSRRLRPKRGLNDGHGRSASVRRLRRVGGLGPRL